MQENRNLKRLGLATLAVMMAAPPASAWNGLGHKVVAQIAWEQMSQPARSRAAALLRAAPGDAGLAQLRPADVRSPEGADRIHFQLAATWPDIVRDRDFPERNARYHRSRWHYINYFWDNEGEGGAVRDHPTLLPQEINTVERLEALTESFVDPERDRAERAVDLAWVLHLTGDLHQPLHTSGRVTATEPEGDRGGNLFRLAGGSNLHSYWDGTLSRDWTHWFWLSEEAYVSRIAQSITAVHPRSSLKAEAGILEPETWARSGYQLARTIVYPAELERDGKPSKGYRKTVHRAALRQIALAGYRLAEILERLDPAAAGETE